MLETQRAGTAVPSATGNGHGLTPDQIARYRENGFFFPLTALDPAEATDYFARVEAFEAQHGARAGQILRQKSHLVMTFADELIRLEPVLDAVESLIGPDILCWSTSFFIKNPKDGKFISWHQDADHWGLEADDIVTAWIALTPSNTSNGCLRLVPRTHLSALDHRYTDTPGNMLTRGQEVNVDVDENEAVDVTLEPGQFSLHHQLTVHGSRANTGNLRRIGFAIRYLRPTARQVVETKDSAMLVRGTDRHGNFAPEPRPGRDMDPENIAFLDRLLSARSGGDYRR